MEVGRGVKFRIGEFGASPFIKLSEICFSVYSLKRGQDYVE